MVPRASHRSFPAPINFAFAIRRGRQLPVWAAFVFAVGLALWLPLLPKPVRIVDGLLIGLGGIPLAWSMWRIAPLLCLSV